ncbi:3-hydroxypropanoate dehydrogenase [Motilibacter rhizosphaerae]|uniref:Putative NADH dehydrogenase/NAD(P)H nitroreductase EV189_0557 n=1 Tax=Motilibacter rhizosphaerae TaxID=598652 RepID=A0A4V2F523_9ACTN|nr:malonic semialdehyde reductase [Motilibacter rhizosphaerae]RZS91319.1 3-hydroxypropanoate dehydrogenase [Motilibacter rhizosphaerae]
MPVATLATHLPALDDAGRRLLFTEARTANSFSDEPVTDAQLHEIYELMKYGPTSANTSPLRILFVRQGEGRDRLLRHVNEGNRAKTASAPVVAVLANDADFHERIPELLPFRPALRDVFAADETLRHATADYNGALQAAYVILAVRAVGLAAGPMKGFDAAGVDAEFFTGTSWTSHLLVNIGHPGVDPWFDRLPRLPYDDAVRYA